MCGVFYEAAEALVSSGRSAAEAAPVQEVVDRVSLAEELFRPVLADGVILLRFSLVIQEDFNNAKRKM